MMSDAAHDMTSADSEEELASWHDYLRRQRMGRQENVAEVEQRLRAQVAELRRAGLAPDEAFLLAVKRVGDTEPAVRGFALERSGRLWRQLVLARSGSGAPPAAVPTIGKDALVAFALALAAAVAIKLPALFGLDLDRDASFYVRNLPLLILPLLTGYFVWERGTGHGTSHGAMTGTGRGIIALLALGFAAAAMVVNAYPFVPEGNTEVLAALHLPIALWLLVGVAYAGGRWGQVAGRMDFVRFSGELLIHYILIAMGGGAVAGLMAAIFLAIGVDMERFFGEWIVPCAATGGVLVATWLVESRQRAGMTEGFTPMLARLFTPFLTLVLLAFLATLAFTGRGVGVDREVLIAFDLVLAVVVALLLYSLAARDPEAPPGISDVVLLVLVVSALLADAMALGAMAGRITHFGLTPNRVAALGENVVLLGNLAWSAVLQLRFLRGRGSFASLERWQTGYLSVYATWAAVVVVVLPPLFGYM